MMAQAQAQVPATGIMSILADKITLPASSAELAEQYKHAKPFPHLVLDNIFPNEWLDDVLNEIPEMSDAKWVHERQERLTKSNLRSAVELGEAGFQFAAFVNSAKFLFLMSELTGVWALLPDPYMGGAGYHVVPSGGKFDVHADRNIDQVTGLRRRAVMLVYLNKSWKSEYGGQLELWDTTGSRCEKVIEPTFNRAVIFEVADQNFHGVRPVVTEERARKSFATYYHTVPEANMIPHNSIYVPSFYLKKPPLYRRIMTEVVPPVLFKVARRLKGHK
jgi:Rps23 Pro-64 3,4-dihydroxylase Tpa1-like proline 4-hydroxylase